MNDVTMQRSGSVRNMRKGETRRTILEAARRQFAAHGFGGATIRGIAENAGKSTGALFANFRDKEAVLDAVLAGEYAAYERQARSYVSVYQEFNAREELGYCIAHTLALDGERSRLALLRCEAMFSWTHAPAQSLLDRRKTFLLELFTRIGGSQRAAQVYLDSMWPAHLENCRTGRMELKSVAMRIRAGVLDELNGG